MLSLTVVAVAAGLAGPAAQASPAPVGGDPVTVHRAAGPISVDGDLGDAGWQGAAAIDHFYETNPGDNTPPKVRTTAWLTYDDRYLYIAVKCDDPDPSKIRAPFVERDEIIGTDDNVAIFLDPRNDRRSAVELRVNPRGIQGDAVFTDVTGNEDFSPDFLYDTAARITSEGWQAELRVPFSSLRYPPTGDQEWGVMVWRNYPRDYRYAIYSAPQPRGSNCYVCFLSPLRGLQGLPSASRLLLVPYASGQSVAHAPAPGEPLGKAKTEGDVGLDVKWTVGAETALDATIHPDFSQVEADVAQIGVNQRFALFYPEKRPFFLEGVDLLETPIQAVYTRTINAPRGGVRVTGKRGSTSYTVLGAQDAGGGLVVLPGPTSSSFAPQDFRSWVGFGRVRRDLGRSFVAFLGTGRHVDGGGYNAVFGPDFQWRTANDRVTGQVLWSATETPVQPALDPGWDGRRLSSGALSLGWSHDTRTFSSQLDYSDYGRDFRDDQGFVPQVGFRRGRGVVGYTFYPEGVLRLVRPYVQALYTVDRGGDLVERRAFPGVFLIGRKNLTSEIDLNLDRLRAGDRLLDRKQLAVFVQVDPSRIVSRVSLSGTFGEEIDFANVRVGRGTNLRATATVRPDPHLTLDAVSAVEWLDVARVAGAPRERLFTAQVQRLKATVGLNGRAFLRLIGQYVTTRSDPTLYLEPVPRRDAGFSGSALFSYRLNWQTALYLGYGDDRALSTEDRLEKTGRQFFVKLSYAVQR